MSVDKNMKIGIVGTGAIASSFSALFNGNGYKTMVIGRTDASLDKIRAAYARIFDTLMEHNLVTRQQINNCAALASYSTRYEDLCDAEIIFETVYEDINIKYGVFRKIEQHSRIVKAIASATSVLDPGDLKKGFEKNRSKFLVAHPFNPAYLVPLVELVGSDETSAEAIQLVKDFLESCGKKVCHMKKSVPGFIANRLQHAMLREALYLVRQGIATAADVDMVLSSSFVPRYTKVGLTQHQDGYGLDMLENLQNYLYQYLCNDTGASPLVSEAVKQGNLGQKTGQGLNRWDEKSIAEFRTRAAEPYWQFFNWKLP